MSTTPWITKDGVADATLLPAARDMFDALEMAQDAIAQYLCFGDEEGLHQVTEKLEDTIAKARGEA
jgi:hypothetical protein